MQKRLLIGLICAFAFSNMANADHHEPSVPEQMVTMNICYLNNGHTTSDVVSFQNRWIKWAKNRDINLFNEILSPVISGRQANESGIDFIELTVTDYANGGRMWADWTDTKKGQSFAKEWGEIASCAPRLQHLVTKYQDSDAMANDRERIVTFTRCEIHEGVSGDDLRAVHQRAQERRAETATNLFWGVMLPRAGGTDARNVFRHANVYADIEGYTASLATRSSRQSFIADYNTRYASCKLPTVWSSNVLSMQEN